MDKEGVESGDIKMGSTAGSAGLADQDGQGKDGQCHGLEDVGSRAGG